MAYLKGSRHTDYNEHDRLRILKHVSKQTERLDDPEHRRSRPVATERVIHGKSSKHKRTATGYIDRRECPSYPYIGSRSRSPESDYIIRPKSYSDDYIHPREHQYSYTHGRPPRNVNSDFSRWNIQAFSSKEEFMHAHGLKDGRDDDPEEAQAITYSHPRFAADQKQYESDVEELPNSRDPQQQGVRSRSYDSGEEGSDVVCERKRCVGSDVAPMHSRQSSCMRSDQRSTRSPGAGSAVLEKRGRRKSDSDSEGGYISLDDHIGGSDCVSNHAVTEDDGEGSDAVGSDLVDGSDIADASDVGDFSEGEDCISGGSGCDDEDDDSDHVSCEKHASSRGPGFWV